MVGLLAAVASFFLELAVLLCGWVGRFFQVLAVLIYVGGAGIAFVSSRLTLPVVPPSCALVI
jgi:hypothetical protein